MPSVAGFIGAPLGQEIPNDEMLIQGAATPGSLQTVPVNDLQKERLVTGLPRLSKNWNTKGRVDPAFTWFKSALTMGGPHPTNPMPVVMAGALG